MHLRSAADEWRFTRRLTAILLLSWLLANLLTPWFARGLDLHRLFGFPLGFWAAAQGALLFYLLLIAVYVVVMDRFEDSNIQSRTDPTAGPSGDGPA
jgi:putative solute:sodium symporter small subunit